MMVVTISIIAWLLDGDDSARVRLSRYRASAGAWASSTVVNTITDTRRWQEGETKAQIEGWGIAGTACRRLNRVS